MSVWVRVEASRRFEVRRRSGASKINFGWEARYALGGRGGADGDVALGHGLSRDLGDNGGTGEEGRHGVEWVEGVGGAGKNGRLRDVSVCFAISLRSTWTKEHVETRRLAPNFAFSLV